MASRSNEPELQQSAKRILVVDDQAIVREPIAEILRKPGYEVFEARDGKEALKTLLTAKPDLVLLDLSMPHIDGRGFLRALRRSAHASIPVILLSGTLDRKALVEMAQLGVQGVILKTAFSVPALLKTVAEQLAPKKIVQAVDVVSSVGLPSASSHPAVDPALPVAQLLTREQCLERAEKAMQAKTLSGVVTQVIAQAASPRSDLSELAGMISRDPMLAARILQIANSASYSTGGAVITTIPEAVRKIGFSAVRNAAAALGIFEAMPASSSDGFNPIRCWQHSFAVARLCEMLIEPVNAEQTGLAYLVGLCHDLGDILFHTQFANEFRQLLEMRERTGRPIEELEREMLGMTRGELVVTILRLIGLPETIRTPIEAFHRNTIPSTDVDAAVLGGILKLANIYAHGLLLAPAESAIVFPFTLAECRGAAKTEHPRRPESALLRGEILALTGVLARLNTADDASLMSPLFPARRVNVWLARDPLFSRFDPVQTALEALGTVHVHNRLPQTAEEWAKVQALVVLTSANAVAFSEESVTEASKLCSPKRPAMLRLVGGGDINTKPGAGECSSQVELRSISEFLAKAA
jgi:HD-like signal output (HDOD) protein/CheY-like chemotaxis protein